MTNDKWLGRFLVASILGGALVACEARVQTEPGVECRNVEVRNRRDVEQCTTRCGDEGCRTHCRERERYAREHRCWVD